jgi:hypothetical protein
VEEAAAAEGSEEPKASPNMSSISERRIVDGVAG